MMNKLITKIYVLILVTLISTGIAAQSGPEVPCVNCGQYSMKTEPLNGLWYNPEQSGVGYSIEIQNGIIFGVYYGYDQDEKPTWLTFVGSLVASDDPEIMWTLDTNLTQFEGGTCLNCEYQAPNTTDFQSTIHLSFKQKNYATLSVNGGASQNMVPLVYGVEASADFPEQTSYKLPDLSGMWTFALNRDRGIYAQWGFASVMLEIGDKLPLIDTDQDGNMEVTYPVKGFLVLQPDYISFGEITCELVMQDDNIIGPECVWRNPYGNFYIFGDEIYYKFPLGGLGASRIFGESTEGHTFEAIKVDSTEYPIR